MMLLAELPGLFCQPPELLRRLPPALGEHAVPFGGLATVLGVVPMNLRRLAPTLRVLALLLRRNGIRRHVLSLRDTGAAGVFTTRHRASRQIVGQSCSTTLSSDFLIVIPPL